MFTCLLTGFMCFMSPEGVDTKVIVKESIKTADGTTINRETMMHSVPTKKVDEASKMMSADEKSKILADGTAKQNLDK